jgi:ribonuclease HI
MDLANRKVELIKKPKSKVVIKVERPSNKRRFYIKKKTVIINPDELKKDLEEEVKYNPIIYMTKDIRRAEFSDKYNFIIYTDGGFDPISYTGSWAYYIKVKRDKKRFFFDKKSGREDYGGSPLHMEIRAVIEAIHRIERRYENEYFNIESITVYTDSAQIVNSGHLINNYVKTDFTAKTSDNKLDNMLVYYWCKLAILIHRHNIKFEKVPAHSGVKHNETCDRSCKGQLKR